MLSLHVGTGTDRGFFPFAVSIRSMTDKVTKVLVEKHAPIALESADIKIPSIGYVSIQFAPKNKKNTTALPYTCATHLYAHSCLCCLSSMFALYMCICMMPLAMCVRPCPHDPTKSFAFPSRGFALLFQELQETSALRYVIEAKTCRSRHRCFCRICLL
jgi:hypothetical protein